KLFPNLERGDMNSVVGIVVHQTGGQSAQGTLAGYRAKGANGAHFLIDKDGTIYQTASLNKKTNHVGQIQSRCYIEKTCPPAEFKLIQQQERTNKDKRKVTAREHLKAWPDRYPNNSDSIGIELVGFHRNVDGKPEPVYDVVTERQNSSLKWLIGILSSNLDLHSTLKERWEISINEIFRHPEIGRKNETEASTAKWK
ncbi:MAG: N-acetylmuramoyl-L-alanine amidase, partial [Cupriavidus sp.]|nr:N-acetylmuramoyl-L-alanine amidase [Cupriavidus sp.]